MAVPTPRPVAASVAWQLTQPSTSCLGWRVLSTEKSLITAYLDWWAAAGLDEAVGDAPANWLAPAPNRPVAVAAHTESPVGARSDVAAQRQRPASPQAPARAAAPAQAAPQPAQALPAFADLAAFDRWLAESGDVPMRHWSQRLALPSGPAQADLMVLSDWPDADDIGAGRLFSGASGALLDAMVQAIALPLERVRCSSIAFSRPATTRFDATAQAALLPIAREQIRLAAPKTLLVVGAEAARLFCGISAMPAAEMQPVINHDGVNRAVFVTHHPRTLLLHTALKRHAWEVLKRVREHLDNGANNAGN